MKTVKLISDYTPKDQPNYLELLLDDENDISIKFIRKNDRERNVRIAASGTRYSPRVRKALHELVKALEESNVSLDDVAIPDNGGV